jgi:hypothetical protein
MSPVSKIVAIAAIIALAAPGMAAPAAIDTRQLAGEGAAADSLFTDTDNGIGYGVEHAEDNTANLISGSNSYGSGSGSGSSSGGPPPPPPPGGPGPHRLARRQGDKMANGAADVLNALNQPQAANVVKTNGDNVDGQLTSGAANAGAQIGSTEETTLVNAGSMVP